jgi:hypothetical protein
MELGPRCASTGSVDVVLRRDIGDVPGVGRGGGGKSKKNTSERELKRSLLAQFFSLLVTTEN